MVIIDVFFLSHSIVCFEVTAWFCSKHNVYYKIRSFLHSLVRNIKAVYLRLVAKPREPSESWIFLVKMSYFDKMGSFSYCTFGFQGLLFETESQELPLHCWNWRFVLVLNVLLFVKNRNPLLYHSYTVQIWKLYTWYIKIEISCLWHANDTELGSICIKICDIFSYQTNSWLHV